ncbi:MAG: rhodanese-like domain-containing protein [Bryobacteraceae bacterium]
MTIASPFIRLNGGVSVPTIEHEAFGSVVADKSRAIVDVREAHEYAVGHIPGAINLPLSRFISRQLPSGKPIVLARQAGGRSAKALQQALGAGHTDICHYTPGTGGWRSRGGALAV